MRSILFPLPPRADQRDMVIDVQPSGLVQLQPREPGCGEDIDAEPFRAVGDGIAAELLHRVPDVEPKLRPHNPLPMPDVSALLFRPCREPQLHVGRAHVEIEFRTDQIDRVIMVAIEEIEDAPRIRRASWPAVIRAAAFVAGIGQAAPFADLAAHNYVVNLVSAKDFIDFHVICPLLPLSSVPRGCNESCPPPTCHKLDTLLPELLKHQKIPAPGRKETHACRIGAKMNDAIRKSHPAPAFPGPLRVPALPAIFIFAVRVLSVQAPIEAVAAALARPGRFW